MLQLGRDVHPFTTVSVTSTFTISPLTLSVAVVNWEVWPSRSTIESLARNERNDGLPGGGLFSVGFGPSPYTDESSIVISTRNRPSSWTVDTEQSMLVPTS